MKMLIKKLTSKKEARKKRRESLERVRQQIYEEMGYEPSVYEKYSWVPTVISAIPLIASIILPILRKMI